MDARRSDLLYVVFRVRRSVPGLPVPCEPEPGFSAPCERGCCSLHSACRIGRNERQMSKTRFLAAFFWVRNLWLRCFRLASFGKRCIFV